MSSAISTDFDDGTSSVDQTLEPIDDVLVALNAARRSRRVAAIDPFDALYHAYLGGMATLFVVYYGSLSIGDDQIVGQSLHNFTVIGPRWLGLVFGVIFATGCRSGGRGGPLSVEAATVAHVLLGPVDRAKALRRPAIRMIRFASFGGLVTGVLVAIMTVKRLPDTPLLWALLMGLVTSLAISAAVGVAMVMSGLRVHRYIATMIGVAFIAWSAADVLYKTSTSPFTLLSQLVMLPERFAPASLLGLVVPVGAIALGLLVVGGISLEAAERRASLVKQMRFAATLRDVRTVTVLRRQLSNERPRRRPYVRLPLGWSPFVFFRDIRAVLRWPILRIGRFLSCNALAGWCIIGVWHNNTTLIIPAGLLMYIAALESAEPIAEESDRPDISNQYPHVLGDLLLRHLPATIVIAMLGGVAAFLPIALRGLDGITTMSIAFCALSAVLGSVMGGTITTLAQVDYGEKGSANQTAAMGIDSVGILLILRVAGPPAMGVLGWLPILFARSAYFHDRPVDAVVLSVTGAVALIFVMFVAWLRFRAEARKWFSDLQQTTKSTYDPAAMTEKLERTKALTEQRESTKTKDSDDDK